MKHTTQHTATKQHAMTAELKASMLDSIARMELKLITADKRTARALRNRIARLRIIMTRHK
jgi:hypothetical protein